MLYTAGMNTVVPSEVHTHTHSRWSQHVLQGTENIIMQKKKIIYRVLCYVGENIWQIVFNNSYRIWFRI